VGPLTSGGGTLRLAIYFATVVCPTSMPSFSNSPWMRGAPQSGLACSSRGSAGEFQLGTRSTASGSRSPAPVGPKAGAMPADHGIGLDDLQCLEDVRRKRAKTSEQHPTPEKAYEPETLRRSTFNWCRSTRFSACKDVRHRNSPATAHQASLQRPPIAGEHQPIRQADQTDWVSGRDRRVFASAAFLPSNFQLVLNPISYQAPRDIDPSRPVRQRAIFDSIGHQLMDAKGEALRMSWL
jgi:hypothetical protein